MKKRSYPLSFSVAVSGALALVALPLLITPARGQLLPTRRPNLPALDTRSPVAARPERAVERERGKSGLSAQLPSAVVDFDPLLDAPQFIRARDGFLTGPNGQGRGVSAQAAAALPATDPLRPIKAFLNEHHDLFGYGAEVLPEARVKRDYVDQHNGLRSVVWEQQLDGIPVYGSVLMGHITRQGELTSLSSSFVPDLAAGADSGTPGRASLQGAPPVSPAQAILLAGQNIGSAIAASDIVPTGKIAGDYSLYRTPEQASVRPVWFPLHRTALRLAWEVWVADPGTHYTFRVVLDAQTGQVHLRQNMTCHISDATYSVYDGSSPSPFAPSLQTPGTFQPPITNRNVITTSALDTFASPDGWIPDGGNTTTGNNADAFVDRDFDGQPDQPRPQGNPDRVFNFPLDLTQDPKSYIDASTVQLFWRANWYHDRLYQLGFTEAAGNFQDDTFGRGGLGNDHVICYVQSGADVGQTDNSMFATPPDGQSGRCYMFVSTATPQRDASLDSEIVIHELTHGTSWRLVGGGMVLGSLQGNSMGEGWSDFYALTLLNPTGADPNAAYSASGYFAWDIVGSGFNQNYYYGIRRYPYSTDMTKNPLTFKDIDPAQADYCSSGAPYNPLFFLNPCSPLDADEVHNAGEVWCATLWELHANLVAKHGWAVGNELALQLATDGMKLTPGAPNFIQARDAILLADRIDNAGANQPEIWRAFAKRGMGFSASSPPGNTTAGIVEAFDMPGLAVDHVVVAGGNGNGVVDNNECDDLTIFLWNNIGFQVTGISGRLSCSTPGVIVVQPLAAYPSIPDGATNGNLSPFRISITPGFVCGTPLDCTLVVKSDQTTSTNQFRIYTGAPATPLRFDNSTPTPIPDLGEATSVIVVSNLNSALSKVTASLYITHTYDMDLVIQLISPDNTTNTLSASNGSFGDNYGAACSPDLQRTTFDDDAAQPIGTGFPPFLGSFQPQTPLSVFIGKAGTNINGNWRLRVQDQYGLDTGTIQCWSLFLTPAQCKDGGGECPGSDLALGMVGKPEPTVVGGTLTYVIGVTNNGPSSAGNVLVTHVLPSGVIFVSAVSSQGTCSQAGGLVTCSLGTIAYGGQATITVVVMPAITGTLSSTASVTSNQSDPDPSNNSATVISHVNPMLADLAVGLAAAPNPLVLGNPLTYSISVTNNGPSAATGVNVTNILPAGAAVLSATVSQGSITAGGGLWTIGTLAGGARATATIVVMPAAAGAITATATVAGDQLDPIVGNNVAAVTTVVGPAADLAISIGDSPDPVVVSSNVTYLVSVTNLGPSAATGVQVSDALPVGVNLISTSPSQGTVSIAGNALAWLLGTLNSGTRATLTMVVQTTTNLPLSASATVASSVPDPNPANNSAAATTQVALPGVAITKAGATLTAESFLPPNGAIDVGETVTVILRLRNSSNVNTLNLVGTLMTNDSVLPVPPNNPQTYGVLAPSGFPVGRSFSFTANGTNGQTIHPTLLLRDGTNIYPPVSFDFTLPSAHSFANTNGILIPDPLAPNPPYPPQSGPGLPYPSVIPVSNLNGTLGKVTVTLSNLTHTYPGDVNVLLVAPSGAKTLLMSHAGDQNQSANGVNLTFDDAAAGQLPAAGFLISGVWQPTAYGVAPTFPANAPAGPYSGALSAFNGSSPNGNWSLYVFDDAGGDQGSLLGGWSLTLSLIVPVNQLADLRVSVADTPDPVVAGSALTYTFTVADGGPSAATSVAFTNVLPAGVTLVSAASSQGLVITNANTVLANLGTLNTNAVATVTVVVVPALSLIPPGADSVALNCSATVGSGETDPNPGNSTVTAVTTVTRPVADVGIVSLTAAPEPAVLGFTLTNTLVVTNLGPSTALAVVVSNPLPAGVTFVPGDSTAGCTNIGGTVTCPVGDLAPNAEATVSIVVIPPSLGLLTNTVMVAASSQDPNLANNSASSTSTVTTPTTKITEAGAELIYESGPANGMIDPGETVSLSFRMANIGTLDTVNLKATLLVTNGVTVPSGPQYYGLLIQNGPSVSRSFTFTAAAGYSNAVVATFQVQDERAGVTNTGLAPVTFAFNRPLSSVWSNSTAIIIPDHGVATPYPSTVTVSDLEGVVIRATVTFKGLTHSFPRDVSALLVGPDGANVLLMSHTGGGHPVSDVTLTFDDAVTNSLPGSEVLASGTYRPGSYPGTVVFPGPAPGGVHGDMLQAFVGRDPNGTWSLYVLDDTAGDSGFIVNGWTLNLETAVTLRPMADLAIGLSTAPASSFVGVSLTNTVWVTNLGPASATGVMVTNKLSTGEQAITNLGGLAAGAAAQMTFVLAPSVGGSIISTASVGANEADPYSRNNSAQTTTTVMTPVSAVLSGSVVNGQFELQVLAEPNFAYAIEVSSNLMSWVSLSTNTASPGGVIKFTDTNSPSFGQRFYRTRQVSP